MIRLIFIGLFSMLFLLGNAQPYGNEWIQYNQKYLKFPVLEDGKYRLTYSALAQVLGPGSPVGDLTTIEPENIQVFGRGEEVFLHFVGDSDGQIESGEYFEFYAERNDGWLDSLVYDEPESQNNPYYSLFNDTIYYYITWNNSSNNRRFVNYIDLTFTGTPAPYFLKKSVVWGSATYWSGWYDSSGKSDVSYTSVEGYYRNTISGASASVTIDVESANAYTGAGAPLAQAQAIFAGVNNPNSSPDHHVVVSYTGNGTEIEVYNDRFESFQLIKKDFTIPSSSLGSASTSIKVQHGPNGHASAKTAVSAVSIEYPHTFNMESANEYFITIPENNTKTYIELTNFSNATTSYVLDLTDNYIIEVEQTGTTIKANIPAGEKKNLFVSTDNNYISVTGIKKVSRNGLFRDFLSEDPDSAYLLITHPKLWDEAIDYAKYRNSAAGGSHDTITANINMLYDMFSYGINKHPLAIRNFARFAYDNFSSKPQNLFLVGKSIQAPSIRKSVSGMAATLVPTFGTPPSDLLFTEGFSGNYYEMGIPVGRLAAQTPEHVTLYMDKVKELEDNQRKANTYPDPNYHDHVEGLPTGLQNKEWTKHVVHFGGGSNNSQQTLFKSYLDNYKSTIESENYGGVVHSVFKKTTNVIEPNLADTIKGWIEDGVSIITFFGHSSSQGFDVSVDEPEFYNNKGKYPLFIANGCYSGNIHNSTSALPSTSEQFILIEDKGAIAFLASVDLGYDGMLNKYTSELYQKIGVDNYGKSIGECIKNTGAQIINDLVNTGRDPNNYLERDVILEMTLHGDPAVHVNYHPLPDYYIDRSTVFFTPEEITSDLNSFDLNIITYNIGMAVGDSVQIRVERYNDNGSDTTIVTVPRILYNDTTVITYNINNEVIGLNQFKIFVDWLETNPSSGNVLEVSETNNSISFPTLDQWVASNDIVPVYPYNYAIVAVKDQTLKASTADPLAPAETYVFQIDTTDTYDSGISGPLAQTTITQGGGVVSWKPNLTNYYTDSAVFFWRVSPVGEDKWREHSFQYIPGKTGWSQDHFFQFKKDDFQYIDYNRTDRSFDFIPVSKQIKCKNVGNVSNDDLYNVEYRIDGELMDFGAHCGTPVLQVAIIDPVSMKPWQSVHVNRVANWKHDYGQYNRYSSCPRNRYENYFSFLSGDQVQHDSLVSMITNSVPDGYYILMYSIKSSGVQGWDKDMMQMMHDLGADTTTLGAQGNSIPYIFFTKKGDPSKTKEVRGDGTFYQTIILTASMESSANWGEMESTLIGPAYQWDSLHWRVNTTNTFSPDTVLLSIYGLDSIGAPVHLTTYPYSQNDVDLTNEIDASEYPYIFLKAYYRDDSLKTPNQLHRWQVIYDEIPELALNKAQGYLFPEDSIFDGQEIPIAIAVENVSNTDLPDSLRVSYWIQDQFLNNYPIEYKKQVPLKAGNLLMDTIVYNTTPLIPGPNVLFVEVNPQDSLWQLEQYHFNNLAKLLFEVNKDDVNPILDVTFDGVHILNGDIVSAKPEIVMQLSDDNPYIPLNDTSDFFIYLTDPNEKVRRIHFTDKNGVEVLQFNEASLPDNKASIYWNPELAQDGLYKLRVQARDGSDNLSGNVSYEISFEVINRSTITSIVNYPNPFTTNTRFVFTLTGSVVPDVFKIQILTVTGKVVREITQNELGPIRVGRNVTQYAWDGTDEFGDPLANGVYLYRVITKINGESIEHRQSKVDDFFKKDFGKMYIMR